MSEFVECPCLGQEALVCLCGCIGRGCEDLEGIVAALLEVVYAPDLAGCAAAEKGDDTHAVEQLAGMQNSAL